MTPKTLLSVLGLFVAAFFCSPNPAAAREYHVALSGDDANAGTEARPFRTIQAAANVTQPGDVVTVHAGVYRERVNPPRGGTSDGQRIVYQAAPGEKVVITGSEMVRHWGRVTNDTWAVALPAAFFGQFNPYSDLIHGDWFKANGRQHHTGAVYLNGDWLTEAAKFETLLLPAGREPLWFGEVTNGITTIWAQFPGVNPNEQLVEVNARRTVFYPEKTGVNFLTVRGLAMKQAATPWAPPTAEQIGLIGTHWSKGWIIESNVISYSTCCGIALGKYGDEWDNGMEIKNPPEWLQQEKQAGTGGYIATTERALTNGWNRATVGSHVVRGNEISHCEQTGIVGSLGGAFSTVAGNEIHDIHVRNLFGGAEMAGIKLHGAIDVVISGNHIYRCGDVSGIWLDWMAQGAQVTGNLLHDNSGNGGDLFLEMQHGPLLVANNLFLSPRRSLQLNAQGAVFVHNLMVGPIRNIQNDKRHTPFHPAHDTPIAGMYPAGNGDSGDHRFYNNLLMGSCSLSALDHSMLACFYAGNVFTKGTQPAKSDDGALLQTNFDAGVKLTQKADGWYLMLAEDDDWRAAAKCKLVTTDGLGLAKVSGCAFENADGSPVKIDTDYFGRARDGKNPFPGPFEKPADARREIKVWPLARK